MCFPLQKMTNKSALWTHCSAAPTAGRSVSYPNNWPSCALNWLCQCSPVSKQTGILKQFATNNSQHILFCLLLFIQQQISFHLHSSINLNVPFTMYSYKSFIMSLFACFFLQKWPIASRRHVRMCAPCWYNACCHGCIIWSWLPQVCRQPHRYHTLWWVQ